MTSRRVSVVEVEHSTERAPRIPLSGPRGLPPSLEPPQIFIRTDELKLRAVRYPPEPIVGAPALDDAIALRFDPHELRGGTAQDRDTIGVAETGRGHNSLDGALRPRVGIVSTDHEPTHADLGGEVAEAFGREYDRVVVHLPEIFRRVFLDRAVRPAGADIGAGGAPQVGAGRVRWQKATAVRAADLQAGKRVERAIEDQVGERYRRLERIADHILQVAVAFEPTRELARRTRALRMDEDQHAELLSLGPEWVEFRVA